MKQLEEQMTSMKLHGMNRNWIALKETRQHLDLSLSEGLEVLLQAEIQDRENKRFERLRKNARFRYQASIEELFLDKSRGVDKELITMLAMGEYINQGESVLITGASGCGKSFLTSALGHQACLQGYKVAYFNTQKLFLKSKMARIEGTILSFFENLFLKS